MDPITAIANLGSEMYKTFQAGIGAVQSLTLAKQGRRTNELSFLVGAIMADKQYDAQKQQAAIAFENTRAMVAGSVMIAVVVAAIILIVRLTK